MSPSEEPFAEAENVWNLDRLYEDLSGIKGNRLTPAEKARLRGLLLGLSPKEIAQQLYINVDGLRVELSRTIYRYVADLVGLTAGINARKISLLLEQAGYRWKANEQYPNAVLSLDNELDILGGQIPLQSHFYVDRPPIEEDCYREILRPGALIRIKAPRQTGKSSLMARVLHYAEQHGCKTYNHSFHFAEQEDFKDLTTFLQRFCANISQGLGLPIRISEVWDGFLSSKMNCKVYFEQYLLKEVTPPFVLGLDEVDRIFQYPEIAADFFGLLRAWHEEARIREIWKRFRLVMVYSTEVYLPLDSSQSPFNVGSLISIPDFRPHQTWELVRRYGLTWNADHIEQLISLIGGHPFLAQVALSEIVRRNLTLEDLLSIAPQVPGLFEGHLMRYRRLLDHNPDLRMAMEIVVASSEPVHLELNLAHRLYSLGLILFQDNETKVVIRCELYRLYFRNFLIGT